MSNVLDPNADEQAAEKLAAFVDAKIDARLAAAKKELRDFVKSQALVIRVTLEDR